MSPRFAQRARLLSLFLMVTSIATEARADVMCAIDMGSNSFRRIVASFENGRYTQHRIEPRTLGVGDDVARNGRISDAKLEEIRTTLASFKSACDKDGAAPVVAIGTAAFRDAPNGKRAVELAAQLGIAMEIATERQESQLAYLVGSLGRDGYAVIDNGSRSIELVSRPAGALQYRVFNLGYRVAYETFFAKAERPEAATAAFRSQLLQHASKAPFMKGMRTLVGVEFGEMAAGLFPPAPLEGRVLARAQLKQKLQEVAAMSPAAFRELKTRKDIDRALPRLVAAATLMEAFGYSEMVLTERELGAGLIIEAGMKARQGKTITAPEPGASAPRTN
jgi:exopolyphosphatase/pppGpp-phosphohydrolase